MYGLCSDVTLSCSPARSTCFKALLVLLFGLTVAQTARHFIEFIKWSGLVFFGLKCIKYESV